MSASRTVTATTESDTGGGQEQSIIDTVDEETLRIGAMVAGTIVSTALTDTI